MTFQINPIKALEYKYKNKPCGMQALNNDCYSICTAFAGNTDPYNVDPKCAAACASLIEDKRYAMYGVGHCDHQAPYLPVIWNQVPHYLPNFLKQGNSPLQSKNMCMQMCDKMMPGNDECKDNCELDFNAIVEPFQKRTNVKTMSLPSPSKDKPYYWIGFSIGFVMISILVIIALRKK